MSVTAATRTAGLLLHPTSLPGPYGIGDLGPNAQEWVDALVRAGQTWWQMLPIGPTGYGDSPYQSFSAFAGNTNLLSPDLLQRDGLLRFDVLGGRRFSEERVDYGAVIPFKQGLLEAAYGEFKVGHGAHLRGAFEEFRHTNARRLDDFALFIALKQENDGKPWYEWPSEYIRREESALNSTRERLGDRIRMIQFGQFLFDRQWQALRAYANSKGIKLIGDVPIFVAGDSADVWANPHLFLLDESRRPTLVAGVPPDYFSPTGQLWGNPLYAWDAHKQTGYAWWIERMRATLALVDLVRIDHFRGFESAWHIPAGDPTAENGTWQPGPGYDLFRALQTTLGTDLPLIAEDLGEITPQVDALRRQCNLPGMRILQFAFSDPTNKYLPHHYEPRTVVYTGTHDNDTTVGWFATCSEQEKAFLQRYLGKGHIDPAWDLLRLAWSSVAETAIAPLQDILRLGSECRMNTPGIAGGNWQWRLRPYQLDPRLLDGLADMTALYSRAPTSAEAGIHA